jgi:hypothetical protein
MARLGAPNEDLTGLDVERRKEVACALSLKLELDPSGSTRSERTRGVFASECLYARLFVEAEHSGLGRRRDVRLADRQSSWSISVLQPIEAKRCSSRRNPLLFKRAAPGFD